jgi:hypothetical protein
MNWIDQYRPYILKNAILLENESFSFLGEDENTLRYSDGDVFICFVVENFSDSLDVWVEYLGDDPIDEEKYRLDIIMRLKTKEAITEEFRVDSESDKDALVKNYVDFIVENKKGLFGKEFPLAQQYEEYNREIGAKALEVFAQKRSD